MNEPEMYPLTDDPKYTERFESFTELRECVEDLDEGLNFVVSWFPNIAEVEECGSAEFQLLIFMPRKSQTTEFGCRLADGERAVVDEWLGRYVKARTMRWYGWEQP